MYKWLEFASKIFPTFLSCSEGGPPGALHPCRTCNGRGIKVTITQLGPGMVQQMQSRCPACDGEGEHQAFGLMGYKLQVDANCHIQNFSYHSLFE